MDRLALADTVAPTDAFRSTNCPASIRSGSSMPLAEAIPCQSPPLPDVAAIDCTLSPCLALAKGRAPARETAPEPSKVETNIFCCDKVSVMLARNGLPSGEKNSSDSSSPSTMPSNMKLPQLKRVPGGASLVESCSDALGVMKWMTSLVSRRTSSTAFSVIAVGALLAFSPQMLAW